MTSSDLAGFRDALAALQEEAASLLSGLTQQQLDWRPMPGVWSTGEIAAHLRTTNQLYLEAVDRALRDAPALAGPQPERYRPSVVGRFLIGAMRSPRRTRAPKVFRPRAMPGAAWAPEVIRYRQTLDRLREVIRAAERVSLNRTRLASPVSRWIRLNLGDVIALWLAHDRRHLLQVRRLVEHPGFPGHEREGLGSALAGAPPH